MSNLTSEQIRNLERDGYTVREHGGNTIVERRDSYGNLTRQTIGSDGLKTTDMYSGNERDGNNHDRFSVNHSSDGRISGHGYDHKKW